MYYQSHSQAGFKSPLTIAGFLTNWTPEIVTDVWLIRTTESKYVSARPIRLFWNCSQPQQSPMTEFR